MEANYIVEPSNSSKSGSGFWNKYFPYWPLLMLFAAVSLTSAWIYLKYQVPVYSAGTSILIKDKEKGNNDPEVVEALNPLAKKNSVENEMQLLRSLTMITAVVNNLQLYAPVYEDSKYIRQSAYKTSPITVSAKHTDSIVQTGKVYFNFDSTNARVVIDGVRYPLDCWVNTAYGILQFKHNKRYPGNHVNTPLFFLLTPPETVATGLSTRLDVSFVNKGSTVVLLTFADESPELAKDFLDELVDVYNKSAIEDQNKLAENTLAFIEKRLRYVMYDLDSIEHRVQQFKANKNAVNIEQQGEQYLANVDENDQKLGDINTQLAVLDQVEKYVLSKDNEGSILPSSLGFTNTTMSELLSKLHTAELEYTALKRTTAKNNPELTAIADQINTIKPALIENINNQRKSLEINRNHVIGASGLYASMLKNIPQKERALIDISREQNIKNTIYTFLLQKREETALSYAAAVPEIKIVDKAISWLGTGNSSKGKVYLIAVVIALAVFFAFVYVKESFNRSVLYKHEIEGLTSLPVIGEIIYEKSANPIIVSKEKQTIISQQFRKLRASLNFLGIDSMRKKLLVTSFISGEGKSFITANLGVSLALTGKRVVLLELDLNHPTLSEKFSLNNRPGIVDYLMNTAKTKEILTQTAAYENLFIIPSGELGNHTPELIMNGKIESLLLELDGMFDHIIIDTAPVGPTTDAYTLSSFCDATLFVVRHNYTPKALVQRIDEEIKINPLKNAAVVFNGVQSRGFTKNNIGLGYAYAYSYNNRKDKTKRLVVRRNN